MDKNHLIAAKNNDITYQVKPENIILKGYRNKRDGLYDIPIQKTILHRNNFLLPKIHPGLYKQDTHHDALPFNFFKRTAPVYPKFPEHLKNDVNYISMETFNNIIGPYLPNKINNTKMETGTPNNNSTTHNNISPSLNVIIPKIKQKMNLLLSFTVHVFHQ